MVIKISKLNQLPKKRYCYKNDEVIRNQVYSILLIIFITITSLSILFYYIRFNVEKIYIYNLDDNFTISDTKITIYDEKNNYYNELTFNNNNLGNSINISSINFGFIKNSIHFNNKQTQISYLYPNNQSGIIGYYIKANKYIVRTFKFDNNIPIQNKFKMSNDFQMFYISITLHGNINNTDFQYTYYTFFNSSNTNVGNNIEINIIIKNLNFNITQYNNNNYQNTLSYPYNINIELIKKTFSKYIFDFSFR